LSGAARCAWPLALLVAAACAGVRQRAPLPGFAAASADLEAFIERERADKALPGVWIAVVDRGAIVWARGFGSADRHGREPATVDDVHRVGSISKLCVDVALLRLAENGRLDLDVPVVRHVPEFAPQNPFATAITARHLLTHHAGLVREPGVGHYFDADPPGLAATVESLAQTRLVYEPGTRLKYSNAGLAVAGLLLERIAGEPWAAHVAREVFAPLGMASASFAPGPELRRRLARGTMWTLDGREFDAPGFALGMAPAANLYASVIDLARLAASWSLAAETAPRRVLNERSLEAMITPQLSTAGRAAGIGLGCFVDRFDSRRRIGHGGAMYGFATELFALPDDDCGVAVVVSVDFANSVAQRIAERALRWVLASRDGGTPAAAPVGRPVGRARAAAFAGEYEGADGRLILLARGEELFVEPPSGERVRVRDVHRADGVLVADDRLAHGYELYAGEPGVVRWRGQRWARVAGGAPPPPAAAWTELIGEYGPDHNVLYVLERAQRLCILIEWFELYPLLPQGGDRFRLADGGLYAAEDVLFERTPDGTVAAVRVGAVRFARRGAPPSGGLFRIEKRLDESALRAAARAARPPDARGSRAPDLVEIVAIEPTIRLDLRYATTNNFMGLRFYETPRALLQRPAAQALARVQKRLAAAGYGLVVFDAYRPWQVTKMFWDATPPELRHFVADPARGSRHNRGCAVDVTLCHADGQPADMPSGYDEFTPRAGPDHPGGTSRERWHRELLRAAMAAEGFTVYEHEWWHFDHLDWAAYPVLNIPL
jgi:D-alanyl-D-alanine dipeptidase/CubicO group peptidase (beta-lactamase class C family)